MKISHLSVVMILVIAIAVACAGCAGSNPSAPATGAPAQGTAAPAGGSAPAGAAAGGPISGSQLFGGLNYNWIEYKISAGSGSQQMTIYEKWTKAGKCTIRFEGAGGQKIEGMPSEMDCSGAAGATGSSGGQAQSNPNDIKPDVKFVKVGTETVTVGAGTFVADKYTATMEGTTATYWIVAGKPLIKMEGSASGGSPAIMELNGMG